MANEKSDKKNYKQTLNLPQTAFPMEAKLVQNEPARLRTWQESHLYEKILAARASRTLPPATTHPSARASGDVVRSFIASRLAHPPVPTLRSHRLPPPAKTETAAASSAPAAAAAKP